MMALNRVNRIGLQFRLNEVFSDRNQTVVRLNDKQMIFNHNIADIARAWYDWIYDGKLIHQAFPFLSVDEREFILTGMLPAEWDEIQRRDEVLWTKLTEKENHHD